MVTAMPPSATAMNTQRSVSIYGTSGRMADWVSARTLCATSTPAAPSVATPAAPPPFMVRLSASTSRAGGVSATNAVARTGDRSPHLRARSRPTSGTPGADEAEAADCDAACRRFETPWNLGNLQRDPMQFVIIRWSISGSSHCPATAIHLSTWACSLGSSANK